VLLIAELYTLTIVYCKLNVITAIVKAGKKFRTSTRWVLLLSVYKVHRVISDFYCKLYLETK